MENSLSVAGSSRFVPLRLQMARHARSLKKNELAERIGRSPAMLSKWESDAYENSPDALAANLLSDALEMPVEWFYKPVASKLGHPFFRSLKSELNRARDQLAAKLAFVDAIYGGISSRVEFPAEDIPDLIGELDFRELRYNDIDRISRQAREFWALGDDPIDDLLLIIENAGVVVCEDTVGSARLDGVSSWTSDGVPLILLARDKNVAARRRFDAAHELGHLVLHRYVTKQDFEQNFNLIEEQAMAFAGAFLLPASSFSYDIQGLTLDNLADKKPKWKVSIGAMIKRLEGLEIVSSDYARNMWKYYSHRQWRGCEPFDDSMDVEKPLNVKAAIEMIAEEGPAEIRDLVADIGLNTKDISDLSNVDQRVIMTKERAKPKLKLVSSRDD